MIWRTIIQALNPLSGLLLLNRNGDWVSGGSYPIPGLWIRTATGKAGGENGQIVEQWEGVLRPELDL